MERHIGKMRGDERLTEGSICDIQFAYNSKLVGYTTSMSHMNELYAMPPLGV
ncbi:MAG: hypothetical protein WBD09_00320 [Halobacteriota archaeon]